MNAIENMVAALMSDKVQARNPSRTNSGCAVYSPAIPRSRNNPFGKDVANLGLWRALARHSGLDELHFVLNQPIETAALTKLLVGTERSVAHLTSSGHFDARLIARLGTLLRGSADLVDLAWARRQTVGDRGYSVIGLVHTVAPPAIRQYIAQSAVAPVQPWDALICTSPVVQQNLEEMFADWNTYLKDRFRAPALPPRMPMLPVLPLGVDGPAIAAAADRPKIRAESRAYLSAHDDDIIILWLGRLSFFEKAFPQPMLQAVEEAQRRTVKRLHFVMLGWFPDDETGRHQYEEAVRLHAPSIVVHILDGNNRSLVDAMWAAADIFLSLVDNVQETFGLTIIEAMAAGLPIVASDWDGYRATLQHGVQGFLVPTLGGPPGLGAAILRRHVLAMETYQRYVGTLAQCTAVSIPEAAQALAVLAEEPGLRRQMGASGQERIRTHFDWPIVVSRFCELFDELANRRSRLPAFENDHSLQLADPVKQEPFASFAAFATTRLHDQVVLRASNAVGLTPKDAFDGAALNRFSAPKVGDIEDVYRLLCANNAMALANILMRFPHERHKAVQASLMWLAKRGFIEWH